MITTTIIIVVVVIIIIIIVVTLHQYVQNYFVGGYNYRFLPSTTT